MLKPYPTLWAVLVALSGLSCPCEGHNGAVAIAVPVEGIVVDGDLSDWPEDMVKYPMLQRTSGVPLRGGEDFTGWFRVGYSAIENALYVAVEAQDESVVREPQGKPSWDTQDGCEIYVDVGHAIDDAPPTQYRIWGTAAPAVLGGGKTGDVEVRTRWSEQGRRHEWRVDMNRVSGGHVRLRPGMAVGFDVSMWDRDHDGSASHVGWERGELKLFKSGLTGDVLLVAGAAPTGRLAGQVAWESAQPVTYTPVRVQSLEFEQLWVQTTTDREGRFAVELPAGSYAALVPIGRDRTRMARVAVQAGQSTEVPFVLEAPQGKVVKAGKGTAVTAGAGHRQGAWHTLTVRDGLPGTSVISVVQDREGRLWLACDGRITCYDGETFRVFSQEDGAPVGVRLILEDQVGNMWLGTLEDGLICYDGETFTTFTTDDGLPDGTVTALLEDRDGNLWIGTLEGGVSRYDGSSIVTFRSEDGLAGNWVTGLLEDAEGSLWISTGGGISRHDGETFATFTKEDVPVANSVICITEDSGGRVWLGAGHSPSTSAGVSRYGGRSFTTFDTSDGLASNVVQCIDEDRDGNVWLGTLDGLSRYDENGFVSFGVGDGLGHNNVACMLEDREGYLWFGTEGGGITRYNGKQLSIYTGIRGLASDDVTAMARGTSGSAMRWVE
jgi:hypothetical protein